MAQTLTVARSLGRPPFLLASPPPQPKEGRMTQALEVAARAQRRLELLAKAGLNECDLSACQIDELATIYYALTAVEFAWVGVMTRPRP